MIPLQINIKNVSLHFPIETISPQSLNGLFLPVHSPITNIVSSSSDAAYISSHERLSFPPQADMNSLDSPGFSYFIVTQPTNKTNKKGWAFFFIEITTQPLDDLGDNTGLHLEKIALSYPYLDQSCLMFRGCLLCLKSQTAVSLQQAFF